MKKDFGSKSWLYPMPVLIVAAYDEQGVPNVMNAAWGGMFTDETIGICLSAGHKTTKNILATRAFTVSMATVDQVAACDYAGIVSGNKVPDKFARAGFHATPSPHVNAPMIVADRRSHFFHELHQRLLQKRSGGHHRSAVNRFSLDSYLLYAKAGSLRSLPLPLPFQIQGCDAKCF